MFLGDAHIIYANPTSCKLLHIRHMIKFGNAGNSAWKCKVKHPKAGGWMTRSKTIKCPVATGRRRLQLLGQVSSLRAISALFMLSLPALFYGALMMTKKGPSNSQSAEPIHKPRTLSRFKAKLQSLKEIWPNPPFTALGLDLTTSIMKIFLEGTDKQWHQEVLPHSNPQRSNEAWLKSHSEMGKSIPEKE